MSRTLARAKKSTTGRIIATGWALRGLGLVAPAAADRLAARLFFQPPARAKRPQVPEVAGLAAHRFEVAAAGRRLAVWDWGEGPTVLLVHGWGGCAAQLSAFVEPLVRAGYDVLAFDHPAHGSSTGRETNLLEMAEALRAVAALVRPVHAVIGHSLGGAAAAVAVAGGLRAQRLVLLASPLEPGHFARAMAAALRLSPPRTEGVLREIGRRVRFESVDLARLAPRVGAETLVLHDPSDREVPFAHAQRIAAALPRARLEPLSGLGHRRLLSDPFVVRRVLEFVDRDEVGGVERERMSVVAAGG